MQMRKVPQEIVDQMVALRNEGLTFKQIAAKVNLSEECCRVRVQGLTNVTAKRQRERRAKERAKKYVLPLMRTKLPEQGNADDYLVSDKYCRGCRYYGTMSVVGACCNYVLVTGHVFVEKPKNCTRRVKGAPVKCEDYSTGIKGEMAVKLD